MDAAPKSYTVHVGETRQSVAGRRAAVAKARELSGGTWRRVELVRADEKVEMTFRGGELSTYTFHTRGRGRHS